MQKLMRATASWCAWRTEQVLGGDRLAEGGAVESEVRDPRCPAHELCSSSLSANMASWEKSIFCPVPADSSCAAGHHLEVVDPGRGRFGPGGLGNGAVGVAPRDERRRHTGLGAVQVDLDAREVLRVIAQLDTAPDEGGVDAIGVALERDRGGAGHPPCHRPPEGLSELSGSTWRCGPVRSKRSIGVSFVSAVHTAVGHLLGPGEEQVVQLLERGDALMGRFGQERLSDVAVEPLLLAAAFWRVGLGVHEAHAEHAHRSGPARRWRTAPRCRHRGHRAHHGG